MLLQRNNDAVQFNIFVGFFATYIYDLLPGLIFSNSYGRTVSVIRLLPVNVLETNDTLLLPSDISYILFLPSNFSLMQSWNYILPHNEP